MHTVTNCSTALIRLPEKKKKKEVNASLAEEQASWEFVEELSSEKSGNCTVIAKRKLFMEKLPHCSKYRGEVTYICAA